VSTPVSGQWGNNEQRAHSTVRRPQQSKTSEGNATGVFQDGTYCVNFHVGGCESPASTIFPVLVYVEPSVSLA
jgi:hypothetical protein